MLALGFGDESVQNHLLYGNGCVKNKIHNQLGLGSRSVTGEKTILHSLHYLQTLLISKTYSEDVWRWNLEEKPINQWLVSLGKTERAGGQWRSNTPSSPKTTNINPRCSENWDHNPLTQNRSEYVFGPCEIHRAKNVGNGAPYPPRPQTRALGQVENSAVSPSTQRHHFFIDPSTIFADSLGTWPWHPMVGVPLKYFR